MHLGFDTFHVNPFLSLGREVAGIVLLVERCFQDILKPHFNRG